MLVTNFLIYVLFVNDKSLFLNLDGTTSINLYLIVVDSGSYAKMGANASTYTRRLF